MRDLTIGEAARRGGVGVETIRFYERRGLIEQPAKPEGSGFRVYPAEVIKRIQYGSSQAHGGASGMPAACRRDRDGLVDRRQWPHRPGGGRASRYSAPGAWGSRSPTSRSCCALSRPLPLESGRQAAGDPASAPGRAQDPRAGDDPRRSRRSDRTVQRRSPSRFPDRRGAERRRGGCGQPGARSAGS
jgi:hypothetical protein